MNIIKQIRNEFLKDTGQLIVNKDLYFVSFLEEYMNDKYQFDFDVFLPSLSVNLQRPFVWSLEQKQELILSLILERYIPNFTMIQVENNSKKSYEIIDGKQRINAICSFMRNEFSVHNYYYKDMEGFNRSSVLGRLKVNMYYSYSDSPISDIQKIKLFQLINFAGVPQEKKHLENLNKLI